MVSNAEELLLENGYGSCILAKPEFQDIVTSAIKYNNGKTYDLIAYVVMPNHVHILIRPYPTIKTDNIIHSIKRFSARQINILKGESGSVWMREYFDRIVRNEDDLKHYLSYIRNNPRHLPPTHYALYFAP